MVCVWDTMGLLKLHPHTAVPRVLLASDWLQIAKLLGSGQQEQTQLIWSIKDELRKVCSTNDLKELLIANKQEVPSGENAVSWSVLDLHVCWVFQSEELTSASIALRSTSLKHVPNTTLQKETQCKAQCFCPRTPMPLLLGLLVKSCVVVCGAEISAFILLCPN